MRLRSLIPCLVIVSAALADTPQDARQFANGWIITGDNLIDYAASVDRTDAYTGAASALLASKIEDPADFAATGQVASAETYRGKRIRFSAGVKTQGVKHSSGLWLRIDGPDGRVLAFDNMQWPLSRGLKGDHAWDDRSVVLDVPDESALLFYGTLLVGSGRIWMDAARIEVVGPDVPVTAEAPRGVMFNRPSQVRLPEPRNLDFEE